MTSKHDIQESNNGSFAYLINYIIYL